MQSISMQLAHLCLVLSLLNTLGSHTYSSSMSKSRLIVKRASPVICSECCCPPSAVHAICSEILISGVQQIIFRRFRERIIKCTGHLELA
ncbi:hypothetical protein DFH11DRAFT_1606829 [Phellopilus nigrolimitatus]|nr:hypothetical protein DFH11DRAFT_1606829 [Phellopilus nigrolimitatus]